MDSLFRAEAARGLDPLDLLVYASRPRRGRNLGVVARRGLHHLGHPAAGPGSPRGRAKSDIAAHSRARLRRVPGRRSWRWVAVAREIIVSGAVLTIAAYDRHLQQLLETVGRLAQALTQAGIDYRVIGGVAVFLDQRLRYGRMA